MHEIKYLSSINLALLFSNAKRCKIKFNSQSDNEDFE